MNAAFETFVRDCVPDIIGLTKYPFTRDPNGVYTHQGVRAAWAVYQKMTADTARMDWIENAATEGVLSMCFEIDGGVFVRLETPDGEISYHHQNTIRDGIDAMQREAQQITADEVGDINDILGGN